MPHIYVTDETRAQLDKLLVPEKRTISDEIDYLVTERCKQLNVPESADSSVKDGNSTTLGVGSQEESGK